MGGRGTAEGLDLLGDAPERIAGVELGSASDDVLDRAHARVDLSHQGFEVCHRHDGLGAMRRELSKAVVAQTVVEVPKVVPVRRPF